MDSRYIRGADKVLRALSELAPKLVNNAIRASIRKSAAVFQQQCVANIQAQIIDVVNIDGVDYSTGLLQQSIVIRRSKLPNDVNGERYVVRISGKKYDNGTSVIQVGRLLEYGHENYSATPWMLPAFEQHKYTEAQAIVDSINNRLKRLWK